MLNKQGLLLNNKPNPTQCNQTKSHAKCADRSIFDRCNVKFPTNNLKSHVYIRY